MAWSLPNIPTGLSTSLTYFLKWLSRPEDWHYVGDTGEPAFENSWVNYDAGAWELLRFYKDPWGTIHIEGVVKSGTLNSTIFTLPEGYRPAKHHLFAVIETATPRRLQVQSDGIVKTNGSTTNVATSLNVSFKAA